MQLLDKLKAKFLAPLRTMGYKPPLPDIWAQAPRDLPAFTFYVIRMMKWDPTVRLGLAMREAPLCNAEFAYKEGEKWVPGIQADKPEVAEFVEQQLQRIWRHDLHKILRAQVWGWSAGEVSYRLHNGRVEFDSLTTRHPADTRALEKNGRLAGVRFRRIGKAQQGHVDVLGPKAFWHAYMPEDGSFYGDQVLRGCYSPWADKWLDGMALDVRRLFAHKDSYGGVDVSYPPGTTAVPTATGELREIPNSDIARQIAEQLKAGGVTTRPAVYDDKGNELWTVTRATIPASPTHIFEYPQQLDVEILRGLEIPDDVLTSENGGAWEGKKVPAQAFFTGLNKWGNLLLADVVKQIIEPLVWLNWGRPEEFEATLKPLGLQSGQEQKGQQPGGGFAMNPFAPQGGFGGEGGQRMSLDPAEAVGQGVLSAAELVKAAKRVVRTRRPKRMAADFNEEEHPRDEQGQFVYKQLADTASKATKAAVASGLDQAGHAAQKAARVAHSAAAKHLEGLLLGYEAAGNQQAVSEGMRAATRHRYFEKLHAGNMRYIAGKLKQLAS